MNSTTLRRLNAPLGRRIAATAAVASLGLVAFAGGVLVGRPLMVTSAQYYTVAIVSAVSGEVTTLGCYDPNPNVPHPNFSTKPNPWAPCRTSASSDDNQDGVYGSHPSLRSVDLAATGTTWAQLDYLPSALRGGYVYAQDASSAGCAATSGNTTLVWVYHYDGQGYYSPNTHGVYFQHISQAFNTLNVWKRWNNYVTANPLWGPGLANFVFEGGSGFPSGTFGFAVGTVFVPTPGVPPPGCSTGAHVHMDVANTNHSETYNTGLWSEGCFNDGGAWGGIRCKTNGGTWAWVEGKLVTERYSDILFLSLYVR